MVKKIDKLKDKVTRLEESVILNKFKPEFWGCRIFYSKEEAEIAHKKYRERNKEKFRPGVRRFSGLTIIHGEDSSQKPIRTE